MSLNKNTQPFKCPLCGAGTKLIEKKHHGKQPTYIWVCEETCPFVAFEFVSHDDLKNLASALDGDKSIVVSVPEVADTMVEYGIEPKSVQEGDFSDWTNTVVDSLQDIHDIETSLREIIVKL